ncbi:MAG TPA: hypothetical protein VFU49_18780 [Ktedonobacteraceae bacterium]|nr:hypothetical protein [Ktedonobacteraceae bacterium]
MLNVTLKDGSRPQKVVELLGKGWSWLFLLALVIFFSSTGQGFFSLFNLQNILTDMAFVLLLALGQTFVIISGGIDLSTGYVMGLASVVSALVVIDLGTRLPLPLVVLIGMVVGVIVGILPGLLNGWFITRLAVPPFIVTLGMYAMVRGAGFLLASGEPVSITTPGIGDLGNDAIIYLLPTGGVSFFRVPPGLTPAQLRSVTGLLPFQLLVSIILVVVCYWLLAHTRFGVHTYAIGGNAQAASRAGIPVSRRLIQLYTLSACFAAIAGVLYMFRYTSGAANAGDPLLIDSIAAAAIGGASLFGGKGTIIGTLIGTLIIAVIQNGLVILGIDPFWQFIAIGAVIILAVFIDQAKAKLINK